MIDGNTTKILERINKNICWSDEERAIVNDTLKDTLSIYQWYYQNASDKQYRDVESVTRKAIDTVVDLLEKRGDSSLAQSVKDALFNDQKNSLLTKNKVLSHAKMHIKQELLNKGVSISRFKNKFSKNMGDAFLEWCEMHPLTKAPEHFGSDWEPPIY